jgi:hypothetical protein
MYNDKKSPFSFPSLLMFLHLLALGLLFRGPVAPRPSPPPPIEYAQPIPYACPHPNVRTLTTYNFSGCSNSDEEDATWIYDVVTVEVRIRDDPEVWRHAGTVQRSQCTPYWGPYWESDYDAYDPSDDSWRDGQPCRCRAVPIDGTPADFFSLDEAIRYLQ